MAVTFCMLWVGKKTGSLTYLDVCNAYINYLQKDFKTGRNKVVFDGYDDPNSIKESEHQRRNKHFSPQFQITASSTIYANQDSFLTNSENKKQLIKMLAASLENQHIGIKQCEGDADVVIVHTALGESQKGFLPTIVM